MAYDWVETNLHSPRTDTDTALLSNVLVGQLVSTDDSVNGAALRDAMLAYRDYSSNDGVQAAPDAVFRQMAPSARFQGQTPTCAAFHADHLGLAGHRSAWAEAATFLIAARRVTVTMTSARVTNLHEPSSPLWDWRPAEVLFESRAFSPAAERRWGITEALSAHVKDDAGRAARPLRPKRRHEDALVRAVRRFRAAGGDSAAARAARLGAGLRPALRRDGDHPNAVLRRHGRRVALVSTLAPGTYSFANPTGAAPSTCGCSITPSSRWSGWEIPRAAA